MATTAFNPLFPLQGLPSDTGVDQVSTATTGVNNGTDSRRVTTGPVSGQQTPGTKVISLYDAVASLNSSTWYDTLQEPDAATAPKGTRSLPSSIANTFALFQYKGMHLPTGVQGSDLQKMYSDTYNGQTDSYRKLVGGKPAENPTVPQILEWFESNSDYNKQLFDATDFIFCKYYRKIPNNYMITLRRFSTPTADNIYNNIINTMTEDERKKKAEQRSNQTAKANANTSGPSGESMNVSRPDIARAITWMGETTGNKIEEVMKFTFGFNYKEQTGSIQAIDVSQQGGASAQSTSAYNKFLGAGGRALYDTVSGVSQKSKWAGLIGNETGANSIDWIGETYTNYVLGPINVINKNSIRDTGLEFEQKISLNFEYELKSFNHINPRVAMLDTMANLLALTYNNARFWGGAHRFYGSSGYVVPPFGDYSKMQSGDMGGFIKSVVKNVSERTMTAFGISNTGGKWNFDVNKLKDTAMSWLNNLAGDALGGFLKDSFGSGNQAIAVPALVSGDPHGCWHMTVGNPLNPILMVGNLHLESSDLSFVGPLGRDDFPTGMKLTCTLKHAKPRDKTDFESMFNAGQGRLYATGFDSPLNQPEGSGKNDFPGSSGGGTNTTTGNVSRTSPNKGSGSGGDIVDSISSAIGSAASNPGSVIFKYGAQTYSYVSESANNAIERSKKKAGKYDSAKVDNLIRDIRFNIDS
jgi:hypothetical protein